MTSETNSTIQKVSAGVQIPKSVIYAYLDEPPFGALGPGERPVGYDFELAEIILGDMGVERIDGRLSTFAELMPGVAKGDWTMNTGMFITPERAEIIAFSDPIWALVDGLVVRSGNPKNIMSYEDAVRDPSVILGVVAGNVQIETALKAGVPKERMVSFKSQHAIIPEIIAGRIDVYPGAALAHRGCLANDSEVEIVELETPPDTIPLGAFSFAKGNAPFVHLFNQYLKRFLGTREHLALARRHGLTIREITPVLR